MGSVSSPTFELRPGTGGGARAHQRVGQSIHLDLETMGRFDCQIL